MGGSSLNPVKAIKKAVKKTKSILDNPGEAIRDLGRKIDKAHYRPFNMAMDKIAAKVAPAMPDAQTPQQQYIAPDSEELARARRRRGWRGTPTIMSQSSGDGLGG